VKLKLWPGTMLSLGPCSILIPSPPTPSRLCQINGDKDEGFSLAPRQTSTAYYSLTVSAARVRSMRQEWAAQHMLQMRILIKLYSILVADGKPLGVFSFQFHLKGGLLLYFTSTVLAMKRSKQGSADLRTPYRMPTRPLNEGCG
jgi:hypothetical protein